MIAAFQGEDLPAYWPVLLFVIGAIVGSFLNVVALRSMTKEDIIAKPSHCPHCQRRLAWFELIPILSFIFLRGRCSSCGQAISIQYPLIEGLTGLAAVLIFTTAPLVVPSASLIFIAVCLLVVLSVIDSRTLLLPDRFITILLAVALIKQAINPSSEILITSFWGIAIGAGFLLLVWLITRGSGIGLGDVKLMVPVGILLGMNVVWVLLLAFIAGGLWGIYLLAARQATPKTAVPFGPFLAAAAIVCLVIPSVSDILWDFIGYPM